MRDGRLFVVPEVLRQTFAVRMAFQSYSFSIQTDPDAINNFRRQIPISGSLFIIASKSGNYYGAKHLSSLLVQRGRQKNDEPGSAFVTITDPGSQMAETAAAEGFMRIFLNQPDIGGRYSALSYFGMYRAL